MFTKFAAVLIAASVIAAPALARTASVKTSTTTPAAQATVKVVKHAKLGRHHVRLAHAKHAKIVKISHFRKHHRSHVVRNLNVNAKALPKG